MCILLFSSPPPRPESPRRKCGSGRDFRPRWEEEEDEDEEEFEGAKEINFGIILPPLAVTRMIALRVPFGPATLTRPVGKERRRDGEEEEEVEVTLSGEEGGVRVWRGEEEEVLEEGDAEGSEIFTVNCSLRLAIGETCWWLLFSALTVGEKGGVSPSREWMEEVEEEEERRPGEEYESSVLLPRPRSQRFSSSRLSLSSSVSS